MSIIDNESLKLSSEQLQTPSQYIKLAGSTSTFYLNIGKVLPLSYDEDETKLVKPVSSTKLTSWNA